MKFRKPCQNLAHKSIFTTVRQNASLAKTLPKYTLRWGIYHGLLVEQYDGVREVLGALAFLRAFNRYFSMNHVVAYWNYVDSQADGRSYANTIDSILNKTVNYKRAKQLESLMALFYCAKWYKQGSKHIDDILLWMHPIGEKYPKLISRQTQNKSQFQLAVGDIMDGISGFIDAFDQIAQGGSKKGEVSRNVFQQLQKAINRGSSLKKQDFQKLWDTLQSTFPVQDRNRFSIELMLLDVMFTEIEEQLHHLEILRKRISILHDPTAKAHYKDRLKQRLEIKQFDLLFRSKKYKETIISGSSLVDNISSLSLSEQVNLLCKTGICYVSLKQSSAAEKLYKQLKNVWLPRFQEDRNLLLTWHEFSIAIAKAKARAWQKKKCWKEALPWANIEVASLFWKSRFIIAAAKNMNLPINGKNQNTYAISLYQRGNIHKGLKRYDKAKEDYRTCIEELDSLQIYSKSIYRKNLSLGWHVLGTVYEVEQDWDGALQAYQQALNIRDELKEVRTDMNDAWLKSANKVSTVTWKKHSLGNQQEAIALNNLLLLRRNIYSETEKIQHQHDIVLVLVAIGRQHIDQQEWNLALPFFTEANQLLQGLDTAGFQSPHVTEQRIIYLYCALCYAQQKKNKEALTWLQKLDVQRTDEDLISQIQKLLSS